MIFAKVLLVASFSAQIVHAQTSTLPFSQAGTVADPIDLAGFCTDKTTTTISGHRNGATLALYTTIAQSSVFKAIASINGHESYISATGICDESQGNQGKPFCAGYVPSTVSPVFDYQKAIPYIYFYDLANAARVGRIDSLDNLAQVPMYHSKGALDSVEEFESLMIRKLWESYGKTDGLQYHIVPGGDETTAEMAQDQGAMAIRSLFDFLGIEMTPLNSLHPGEHGERYWFNQEHVFNTIDDNSIAFADSGLHTVGSIYIPNSCHTNICHLHQFIRNDIVSDLLPDNGVTDGFDKFASRNQVIIVETYMSNPQGAQTDDDAADFIDAGLARARSKDSIAQKFQIALYETLSGACISRCSSDLIEVDVNNHLAEDVYLYHVGDGWVQEEYGMIPAGTQEPVYTFAGHVLIAKKFDGTVIPINQNDYWMAEEVEAIEFFTPATESETEG